MYTHCFLYVPLQISELEKELRLKLLNLKETKQELDTERIVSSKVYDEVRLQLSMLGVPENRVTGQTAACDYS